MCFRRLLAAEQRAASQDFVISPAPRASPQCGSTCLRPRFRVAGTYNLTQPEMATQLADRKLGHIASTGAPVCATGNVGCAMHLASEAAARGTPLRVVHPVELLHRAVFGEG